MGKQSWIAGLELGAQQFVLAVGSLEEHPHCIVRAVQEIPARGLERGGVLTNPVECTDTLAHLLREVEKTVSSKVTRAMVALHGNHLKSFTTSTSVPIPDPTVGISRRDVERALTSCKTLSLEYDRQLLHTFIRGFSVDGQSGIKDPVGLSGTKLGVELHLVTAQNLATQNLTRVLHRAGLEVEEFVLPALASAEVVLSDLDRDLGVTLIYIGEFQTQAVILIDGLVRETFLISWGIDHLTESLGRSLKLPRAAVDQLLEQLRTLDLTAVRSGVVEGHSERVAVPLHVRAGSISRTFSQGEVVALVSAKVKELLMRIKRQLEESPYFQESAAGITMVGPLARLEGFLEMAESLLNMPVRLGIPHELELDPQVTLNSLHTTALGLLHYAAKRQAVPSPTTSASPWVGWVERTRKLLEEYF